MRLKDLLEKTKFYGRNNLTESEAREVLTHYKIPVIKGEIISSIEEAIDVSKQIGYPVVLKVASRDIIHKTDAGGVILDIKDEKEMTVAFSNMLRNIKNKHPTARIEGFFVQQMLKDGYELIVGGKQDDTFGPVVMLGFGGIFVEIFDDVAFRVAPVSKEDVLEMIEEIKAGKILKGYRGRKPANINELVDVVIKTSKILLENPEVKELDINPLIVNEHSAVAVDARIILK